MSATVTDDLSDASFVGALAVEVRGVHKSFGERVVLGGLDINVARGEFVAMLGASGSGKTTFINILGGLDHPTSGSVVVDGREIGQMSERELTRYRSDKIGFIFQFFNLLPTLNCLENVALPLHLRGWSRQKAHARARELLDLVQLGKRVEHQPDELSGGERQRVAIARALSVYPPIVLADEPTGNLDTRTGGEILRLIHDLRDRLGATVLVVTHDKNVAESCQRTVTLSDGKIIGDLRR